MSERDEALWLAQKMGLPEATLTGGVVDYVESVCYGLRNYSTFEPRHNKSHWTQVLLWWTTQGNRLHFYKDCVRALNEDYMACAASVRVDHDNTDAGIMAATITAICRAAGMGRK